MPRPLGVPPAAAWPFDCSNASGAPGPSTRWNGAASNVATWVSMSVAPQLSSSTLTFRSVAVAKSSPKVSRQRPGPSSTETVVGPGMSVGVIPAAPRQAIRDFVQLPVRIRHHQLINHVIDECVSAGEMVGFIGRGSAFQHGRLDHLATQRRAGPNALDGRSWSCCCNGCRDRHGSCVRRVDRIGRRSRRRACRWRVALHWPVGCRG